MVLVFFWTIAAVVEVVGCLSPNTARPPIAASKAVLLRLRDACCSLSEKLDCPPAANDSISDDDDEDTPLWPEGDSDGSLRRLAVDLKLNREKPPKVVVL